MAGATFQARLMIGGGSGGGDPYFSSVTLLMGFEGTNGATGGPGMTDESPAAHGLAPFVNSSVIDTSQFKFGTSSMHPSNVFGDIQYNDSNDWQLSAANSDQFTVECWIRFSSLATAGAIVGQLDAGGLSGTQQSWFFWITTAGELRFVISSNGTATYTCDFTSSGAGIVINTWYHIAVDKDATGKVRIYKSGTMVASNTPANSAMFNAAAVLFIGGYPGGTGFAGWIDELRITKGVARYASDAGYTVPTTAFPRS